MRRSRATSIDPELVNIFLDLDRRGLLLVAVRSTRTDTTTPAVLRAKANPVVATGDQRLSPALAERVTA
ncbi:MAG: hypothetical protein ACLP1E_04090 [Acidimicrobiales bacterium]